jgi:predicted GNAT superfamily acetyltransferase
LNALAPTLPVDIRILSRPDDCARCEALYREVFGLEPDHGSINARLLVSLGRNSGMVIGAYANGELVGFALSFLARQDDGRLYQYSQTAAVLPAWQGRGVGRAMKFAQRSAALAAGTDLLRWTFDPLRPANAHFNLDVLGAVVTGLERDYYGTTAVPGDRGEPTDRFLVGWELLSPPVRARAEPHLFPSCAQPGRAPRLRPGEMRPGQQRMAGRAALLGVPADWQRLRRAAPSAAAGLREEIVARAAELIEAGLVAVSCTRLDGDCAVYRFVEP